MKPIIVKYSPWLVFSHKCRVLEVISEKASEIYEKIQKYDKKNNIENLNKLENDLNEFWNSRYGVLETHRSFFTQDIVFKKLLPDNILDIFIKEKEKYVDFFQEIRLSTTNNIINDFLFYCNFDNNGEYISESISMEFITKLIEIKNRFSPKLNYFDLGLIMKDVNIEKNLHQQQDNVKESIISVLNLSGLQSWPYYSRHTDFYKEDFVPHIRRFLNLYNLFYKDKELYEKLKKLGYKKQKKIPYISNLIYMTKYRMYNLKYKIKKIRKFTIKTFATNYPRTYFLISFLLGGLLGFFGGWIFWLFNGFIY